MYHTSLKNLLSDKQETTKVTTRRSSSNTHIVSPQTRIFQRKCVFCKQSEKQVKKPKQRLIQVATTQFESKIKEYEKALSDRFTERGFYTTIFMEHIRYLGLIVKNHQRYIQSYLDLSNTKCSIEFPNFVNFFLHFLVSLRDRGITVKI